jgi:hypothetical protein
MHLKTHIIGYSCDDQNNGNSQQAYVAKGDIDVHLYPFFL